MEAGSVLAITQDDSSISFFEARSMRPITENEDDNIVTSMPNAGFTFPIDASGRFQHDFFTTSNVRYLPEFILIIPSKVSTLHFRQVGVWQWSSAGRANCICDAWSTRLVWTTTCMITVSCWLPRGS